MSDELRAAIQAAANQLFAILVAESRGEITLNDDIRAQIVWLHEYLESILRP